MSKALSGVFHSLARSGVEQHTRLIAILPNSLTLQIEIREEERGIGVVFGDRLPKPLRRLSAVTFLTIGSVQITLRGCEFFGTISRCSRLWLFFGDWSRGRRRASSCLVTTSSRACFLALRIWG